MKAAFDFLPSTSNGLLGPLCRCRTLSSEALLPPNRTTSPLRAVETVRSGRGVGLSRLWTGMPI